MRRGGKANINKIQEAAHKQEKRNSLKCTKRKEFKSHYVTEDLLKQQSINPIPIELGFPDRKKCPLKSPQTQTICLSTRKGELGELNSKNIKNKLKGQPDSKQFTSEIHKKYITCFGQVTLHKHSKFKPVTFLFYRSNSSFTAREYLKNFSESNLDSSSAIATT